MYLVVLALGILATAAGGFTIGWGFTIKEFSLGNTLLIAGTTAFIGGIVIIGVAGAIQQLRRIAEAMTNRQMPRYPRAGEPYEPYPSGAMRPGMARPAGAPMPPMPPVPPNRRPDTAGPDLRTPEPRLTGRPVPPVTPAPPITPAPPSSLDGGTIVVDESDAFPLSPQQPQRAAGGNVQDEVVDKRPEPIAEQRDEAEQAPESVAHDGRLSAAADIQVTTHERPLASPGDEDAEATAERRLPFDDIWPVSDRFSRRNEQVESKEKTGEPVAEQLPPHASSRADAEMNSEPHASEQPSLAPAQFADAEAAGIMAVERAVESEPVLPPKAEPPRAVSILKSGVVDGMAYTLYSDGSIEAELAGETIRFASITELRQHIEASA